MNLSTLSGPELRQLLDSARASGQARLSYQILQEMEARRAGERPRGLFRARRSGGEPRELVLGDPDDAPADATQDDIPPMPMWTAPVREPPAKTAAAAKPKAKPARTPSVPPSRRPKAPPPRGEGDREAVEGASAPPEPASPPPEPPPPRSVWDDAPEPLPIPPPLVTPPPRRPGLSRATAAVFAAGMAAGVVLGVGVAELRREPPAPSPAPAAALAPAPAPVEPAPALAPMATDAAAAAAPVEPAPEAAAETGPALELPREPEPAEAETAAADPCAARPTPADRTICADPELQRLQRDLRRAYATALAAHEDRDLLRQRQLAWRDARSGVSDRDRLAALYEERIRRLESATEAARRER